MADDDNAQLEFGSRGEEITYRIAGRTAEISFTWIDGPRIYVDGINAWADGATMTEAEKTRVLDDVIALVTRTHERPTVVINTDDPARDWWDVECSRRSAAIFQVEYTSNAEHAESQREMIEEDLAAGKDVVIVPPAPKPAGPLAPSRPVTRLRDSPGLWWLLALLFIGVGGMFTYVGLSWTGDRPWWQFSLATGMGLTSVAAGVWWAWRSPLSTIVLDHDAEQLRLTQFGLFGRRREHAAFSEIREVVVERESDNDGAMVVRPVLVLRDGRRMPLSAIWRHDLKGIANVVATIRAAIRRPSAPPTAP